MYLNTEVFYFYILIVVFNLRMTFLNMFGPAQIKENFMAPFYGWSSTFSRLQCHYRETVYFLPLSSQKFLVPIWLTSKGWKAESTLGPLSGFEPG